MGKYEPLGHFLLKQNSEFLALSFSEIEQLLGRKLPASSREHRAWWSNNPQNNVMTREWLNAGYETESVDLGAEKLVFRKVKARVPNPESSSNLKGRVGGKYRPLGDYLKRQDEERISMTFSEIEDIIGSNLPGSKIYPAWWSNNPGNNTMTQEWLNAGYYTVSVDTAGAKLIFKRIQGSAGADHKSEQELPDHPIWGSMAGTITVVPGVDLTEPMEFEWGGTLYNE